VFCDPSDPGSMSAGVGRLLNDPELSQRVAAAAKKDALIRFHPLVIARAHLEIYREVLKQDS